MSTKPTKKNQESESLQEQIIKLEKQLESFKHSNDHFLKNKLFLHYDVKEPEKVVVDCETKLPILAEVDKKKIQKWKESDSTHLLIEGDNYHALSVLNYTYAGKIDLIYIDPPYNTGAKDWKYNNDYVDSEDTYRHSKWLAMMDRRLRLAKKLLKDDGVLMCAIDKNEQANLGVLLDGIFADFEIHCITIVHNPRGVQGKNFSYNHEYVYVLFRKGLQVIDSIEREEVLEEELRDHGGESLRTDARNCFYPIIVKNNKIVDFGDVPSLEFHPKKKNTQRKDGAIEVWPIDVKGVERKWVFARNTVEEIKNKLFVVKKKDGQIDIFRRKDTQKPRTVWTGQRYDASTYGSKIVNELTGTTFPFPKSLYTVYDCLFTVVGSRPHAIILDFFAGSGTTGHAVLKLNAQDGGTRQFILCTNNENKIAEDVTYPRIKKVIDGYGDNAPIPANLRYFKTDFVEKIGSASQLKIDLTRQCADMLCVKENVFEEMKLKKATKNYKFFKNGNKYLAVFFDFFTDPEFEDFIKELNVLPKEAEKAVYIFVLDGSASIFADEFADVINCEVKEIPQKILDIYKQLAREVARK